MCVRERVCVYGDGRNRWAILPFAHQSAHTPHTTNNMKKHQVRSSAAASISVAFLLTETLRRYARIKVLTHTHIQMHACMRSCLPLCVYMCVYMCACAYTYVYRHTNTHTHVKPNCPGPRPPKSHPPIKITFMHDVSACVHNSNPPRPRARKSPRHRNHCPQTGVPRPRGPLPLRAIPLRCQGQEEGMCVPAYLPYLSILPTYVPT